MMTSTQDAPRTISRRSLVKGAAHAAWVVPAVQVVSTVPAFACSNPSGSFTFSNISASWVPHNRNSTDKWALELTVTITNTTSCACDNPTVTIAAPDDWGTDKPNDGTLSDHSTPTYSDGTWPAGAGKGPLTYAGTGTFDKGGSITFKAKLRAVDWETHEGDTLTLTVLCGGLSSSTTITV
jgi:hypothetical protein